MMEPVRVPYRSLSETDGVSRREMVLGASATGLALALFARGFALASAQEGTPEAEGGLPPGLAITPMIDVPIPVADVPEGEFKVSIYRITLEPGTVVPNSSARLP